MRNQKTKQPNKTITLDADVPPTNYNTTGSIGSALKQLLNVMMGQNSQIPLFLKIFCNLPLFTKYIAIYHFFETRFCENQVFHGT